ncbi:conserved hypothetical protein [Neospora caninum Liverpool]|uniref:Uncharacterized protein n=1 Tax=Neospora caninum (strain Liverpool) TaxID=572307 RepID=F0V8F0_NEOCL|nr:conserved hypothetical protein [Neospora caninum Liverpool]CBZ49991.1 conserved hypothetical protein [Neospora caninum Liverpool]CEL64580.1 TPA: hypothetical protein BN1204_004680 [Neospora caninum Liverpool]|eukprot:XP_003880026.1 conserved hypothetical protein [Neospora caninum Liverpool]
MALNAVAPVSPLATESAPVVGAADGQTASLPVSPVAALSHGSTPPSPSATGPRETVPKAEDSPAGSKAGSRRPSFLGLRKHRADQGNETENGEETRHSRRNSFATKAKALLGKSKKTDATSVNEETDSYVGGTAEANEEKIEMTRSPKAESRTDKWRRRLSLSRDRSVELIAGTEDGALGCRAPGSEPASPKNDASESRLGRLKRRLSLSKDGDRSRRPSHVGEAEIAARENAPEKETETANGPEASPVQVSRVAKEEAASEPKATLEGSEANTAEASPTNGKSESRVDRWKRRLSLSRDCSVERNDKGENIPKSPVAEEESNARRFLHRLSISSRDEKRNSDSEREGEAKEGRMSRLRRRLSISKKDKKSEEQEQGERSEVEKESRGRRILRRLSVSSRKSAQEEGEGANTQESTSSKLRRRLSLSSRASRASREGSICSNDGEDKKEGNTWRRRLSLRSRSREPPLPCPAGQQTRKSLKEKVKGLVKRRNSRAEDMERVEQLHNPDYKPGTHKIEFESSEEESEKEDEVFDMEPSQGAGNLTEGFAVSSESSPVASSHPETEAANHFPVDEHVSETVTRLETPKDFDDWMHSAADVDAGIHLAPDDTEETSRTVHTPRAERKEDDSMFGMFCCGVEGKETADERQRWKEALRYSCSKMRPQEKIFMQQPLVCRELGFDDFESGHKLCYAPTEYSLEIEKAF